MHKTPHFTSCSGLHVLAVQELLVPLLVHALFLPKECLKVKINRFACSHAEYHTKTPPCPMTACLITLA